MQARAANKVKFELMSSNLPAVLSKPPARLPAVPALDFWAPNIDMRHNFQH